LHSLIADPAAEVRAALLRDWWMDPTMELELARDKDASVRMAVASLERSRKTTQLLLANDPDQAVRTSLLKRDGFFMSTLHPLAQETLARDKNQPIRELLAAYPRLKPSAQMLLSKDEKIGVRKALAKGHDEYIGDNLCEEAQLSLARDQESAVRLALAENRHLHPAAQLLLAQDTLANVRLKLVEASSFRRQLAAQTLRVLAKDPDSNIRQELACKLFGMLAMPCEEDVLLALASDRSMEVKHAIISSLRFGGARVSDAVRQQLLEGLDEDIRETVEEMLNSSEED